jgi:hypothetical protein
VINKKIKKVKDKIKEKKTIKKYYFYCGFDSHFKANKCLTKLKSEAQNEKKKQFQQKYKEEKEKRKVVKKEKNDYYFFQTLNDHRRFKPKCCKYKKKVY